MIARTVKVEKKGSKKGEKHSHRPGKKHTNTVDERGLEQCFVEEIKLLIT